MSTDFLDRQLETYGRGADVNERSRLQASPQSRDSLEAAVAIGVALHGVLLRRAESFASRGVFGEPPSASRSSEMASLAKQFTSWREMTDRLLIAVKQLTSQSYHIAGVQKLDELLRETKLTSLDFERVAKSARDAMSGKVRPLRQVADEFRRQRHG